MLAGSRGYSPSSSYFNNNPLTPRRGLGPAISPLGGGYAFGNGLGLGGPGGGLGGGFGAGGLTGLASVPRYSGMGGLGALSNLGVPPGFGGSNVVPSMGSMLTRPRLNPLLGGIANFNPQFNAMNYAQRNNLPQVDLSTLLRRRNDAHQVYPQYTNLDRYVQPRFREDHLILPVVVQSVRESSNLLGQGSNNVFTLTMPASATVADIEVELQQGNWTSSQVGVFNHANDRCWLSALRDADDLIAYGAMYLIIYEN